MTQVFTDPLTKALFQYRNGQLTQDQFARIALPVVKRVVGVHANASDSAYIGEAVQETAIKLFTEIVERADLDNYSSVLPMLSSYAKNVLRHAVGTESRYLAVSQMGAGFSSNGGTIHSEDERSDDEVMQSITGESASDSEMLARADKSIALEKLAAYRSALARPPVVPLVIAKPAMPCIPRTSVERASQSGRRREITVIRNELGLGLAQFASLIGATVEQLKHYAKNKGHVTEAALEKARSLHVNGNAKYRTALATYSNRLMSEIVEDWARRAGVAPDPDAVAIALGVSKKTVQRWLANTARPTWRTIMAIDTLLENLERSGGSKKPH